MKVLAIHQRNLDWITCQRARCKESAEAGSHNNHARFGLLVHPFPAHAADRRIMGLTVPPFSLSLAA